MGHNLPGVPLAEDSALIDAGLDFALGEKMTSGVSYSGQFGEGVQDNAVKGRFAWVGIVRVNWLEPPGEVS